MGYTSAGGRLVRETFKTEADAPYVHPQTNKRVQPTSLGQATAVALKGAKEVHGHAPVARKLSERQRSLVNANQAFIRFQDNLRSVHRGNIDKTLDQLGAFAPALSRTRNDLATLAWLGSEFAENLLATIYRDKKNASADPTQEQEISAAFARHALTLLNDGRLQPPAFNALLAGFAAGMRGLSGEKITHASSNPNGKSRTAERNQLANPDVSLSANAALNSVLQAAKAGETTATIAAAEVAVQMARTVETLPELMDWIRSGGAASAITNKSGKRTSEPVAVAPLTTRSIQAKGESKTEVSTPRPEQPPLRSNETKQERPSLPNSATGSTNIPESEPLTKGIQRLASELEAIRTRIDTLDPRGGKSSQEYATLHRAIEGLQEQIRILNQRLEELTKSRPWGPTITQTESKSAQADFATQTIWKKYESDDEDSASIGEKESTRSEIDSPIDLTGISTQSASQVGNRGDGKSQGDTPADLGTPLTLSDSKSDASDADQMVLQPQAASPLGGTQPALEPRDLPSDSQTGRVTVGTDESAALALVVETKAQQPAVAESPSNTSTPRPPLSTALSAQQILEYTLLREVETLQAKVDQEQAALIADAAHALRMEAEHQALSERLLVLNAEVDARQEVLDESNAQKALQPSSPQTKAQPTQPDQNASAISPVPHDDKATSSTSRTLLRDRASATAQKRRRPDMSSEFTDRERSRGEHLAQARAIAAANDEPPAAPEQFAAQPAIGHLDPGAVHAQAGPMPGEQPPPIPVDEPPQVAPRSGANPANENDMPAEQRPAAGTDAGSGLTLPRHPTGTSRPSGDETTGLQAKGKPPSAGDPTTEFPDGKNEFRPSAVVPPASARDPGTRKPQLTITGGKPPAPITDTPITATSITTKPASNKLAQHGSAKQPDTQLREAIDKATDFIREGLLPAAHKLALVLTRNENLKFETVNHEIAELLDQQSRLVAGFESELDQEITTRNLDGVAARRMRQQLTDKVAAIQPHLFEEAFLAAGSNQVTRLRFASRLFALIDNAQATEPHNDRTTRFARDMLSDLDTRSSKLMGSFRHWRPQFLQAEEAAQSMRAKRTSIENPIRWLPTQLELTESADEDGQAFATRLNEHKPNAGRMTWELLCHMDKAVLAQEDLAAKAIAKLPKPDASSDEARKAQLASQERSLKAKLESLEGAMQDAMARSICNGLMNSSPKVRENFARAVLAANIFLDRNASLHGKALAYADALRREMGQNALDKSDVWAQALAAARSTDRQSESVETKGRPSLDLQGLHEREARTEDEPSRLVLTPQADEVEEEDDVEDVEVSAILSDVDEADPQEIAQASADSQALMKSLEGRSTQENAQAIAKFLGDKLAPSVAAGDEEDDNIEIELDPEVRKALLKPILDGLDDAIAASLLSHLAPQVTRRKAGSTTTKPQTWNVAQEAIDLVAQKIVTSSAATSGIDAHRESIVRAIQAPVDAKAHSAAARGQIQEIDMRLGASIVIAQARHKAQAQPAPDDPISTVPPGSGVSKSEFNQVMMRIEESLALATELLATPARMRQPGPSQDGAFATRRPEEEPAPGDANEPGELPAYLPAFTRMAANAALKLKASLQAPPVDAADWADRMAAICYGIDAVRYRQDHAAAITFDSNRNTIDSMSSSTVGEQLARLLRLDQAAGPVDPAHLGAALQGLVTHARRPADIAVVVGGLLGVTHRRHLKAVVSAAVAVVQMPDAALVGQPLVDARANARQLLALLATNGATAGEMAALAKDNPLLNADNGKRDAKSYAQDPPAWQSTTARKPPQVSAKAIEDPASLLDEPVADDTEDPWSARLEQVNSVMGDRLQQRQNQRLSSSSQSAEVDNDLPAWRAIGRKIASKLELNAVVSAREFTTWDRLQSQSHDMASALNAILGKVSDDAGLVELLHGMANDVTLACMQAFAQATLTAAAGIHQHRQQERALKVVGAVFQTFHDRLSADLGRRGQPEVPRAARAVLSALESLLEKPAADLTSQARLAFSARYSSPLKDAKGAPGEHV